MTAMTFSRTKFLQSTNETIHFTLSNLISTFAVIGRPDVALTLQSKLNNHDRYHNQHVTLKPLRLLWHSIAQWPDGEKEKMIQEIERDKRIENRRKKVAKLETKNEDRVTDAEIDKYIEELGEEYIKDWARDMVKTEDDLDTRSTPLAAQRKRLLANNIIDSIDELDPTHVDAETGYTSIQASSRLVAALDLVLDVETQGEKAEPAPSSEAILKMISKRMSANLQLRRLTQSRRAWAFLVEGALAKALNLDLERVDKFAREIETLVDERFQNVRVPLEDWPMRKILEQIDSNHRDNPKANDPDEHDYGVRTYPEFFRSPATAGEIAKAEKRLEVELPEDYKEFLSITNGCGPLFNGILYEPALDAIQDIIRITNTEEDYFAELTLDMISNDNPIFWGNDVQVGPVIRIGIEDIDNTWLIPPSKMDEYKESIRKMMEDETDKEKAKKVRHETIQWAGSEEAFWGLQWGCLEWVSGGVATMTGYPSFKAYLRTLAEEGAPENEGDLLKRHEWVGYAFVTGSGEVKQEK